MAEDTTVAWRRYDYIRHLLESDVPPPAKVVELGAAPGDQSVSLARRGYKVTAVDIGIASDAWAGTATEVGRMQRMFEAENVDSIEWNLENTPYPLDDDHFDAVLMTEVYEHLRDYPVRSLQEALRVLRPGGRLYLTTPNAAYFVNRLRLLSGRSTATPLPDWIGGLPHARHAREYTFGEVDELLRYAGLEPVSLRSREFYIGHGARGMVKRAIDLTARARPTLGPSIIAVARKPLS